MSTTPARAELLPPLEIVAPPETIEPGAVADHVGDVVVLDATIASAKVVAGRVELRPAGAAGERVRIVIVPPLIGESARKLVSRFPGHHVHAVGRVHEFDGQYEIFTTNPERVEILDPAPEVASDAPPAVAPAPAATRPAIAPPAAPAPPAPPPPPPPPAPPAPLPSTEAQKPEPQSAPPPPVAPAAPVAPVETPGPRHAPIATAPPAPPVEPPAPPPAAADDEATRPPPPPPPPPPALPPPPAIEVEPAIVESPPTPAPQPREVPIAPLATPPGANAGAATSEACRRARQEWTDAAARARGALATLEACLAHGPPCTSEMGAMRTALAEVAAQEQRIAWLCESAP